MITRKPAPGTSEQQRSINVDVEVKTKEDVEVIQSDLTDAESLKIEDEIDSGGDPYNSTGQFCIPAFKEKERD